MSNVRSLKDFSTGALQTNLQNAIDEAVNVPNPNENTDLHLALVPVGRLREVIALLGPRK